MPRSALEPIGEAVYTALNVSAFTTLASGGVYDDPPQSVNYPFAWYTVREDDTEGTFGQIFKRCRVRVHCFSQYAGNQEAQQVINKAVDLIRGTTPSLTNHTAIQVLHEGSTSLPDELINGIKTKHIAADFVYTVAED